MDKKLSKVIQRSLQQLQHADDPNGDKTAIEIAREVFPDKDDVWLNDVVWSRTGFPVFFAGDEPISVQLRNQLRQYRWHLLNGTTSCDFCNNPVEPNRNDVEHPYLCSKCAMGMEKR